MSGPGRLVRTAQVVGTSSFVESVMLSVINTGESSERLPLSVLKLPSGTYFNHTNPSLSIVVVGRGGHLAKLANLKACDVTL